MSFHAFDLPSLSDFLSDHTLLEKEPENRISEHCRRWSQAIGAMWRAPDEGAGYAIRFNWNPSKSGSGGNMSTCILVRGSDELASVVANTLTTIGFDPVAADPGARNQLPTSAAACCEIAQRDYLVPIEQPGDLTPPDIQLPDPFVKKSEQHPDSLLLYGIHPWWGPGGAFLAPFHAIAAQRAPVTLFVVFVPTILTLFELEYGSAVARSTESLASLQTRDDTSSSGRVLHPSQSRTDPQMRWLSHVYAAHFRSASSEPFLVAAYCASTQKSSAEQVAYATAGCIRESPPVDPPLGESECFQSGADVRSIPPAEASKILSDLRFPEYPSGSKAPHKNLARLRHIASARAVATAARFPVNVRGGIPGFRTHQIPPDVIPGPESRKMDRPVILGELRSGGVARIPANDFTRHTVIPGFTGTGKTVSTVNILHQLHNYQVPFLVIEPAKREYRCLLGLCDYQTGQGSAAPALRIYTPGNELVAPLRLNPFQLMPGVSLEAHINNLLACFKAALPPLPFLPSILAESIELIYEKYGWALNNVGPKLGSADPRLFPKMQDLYDAIPQVVEARGYDGEVKWNVLAATKGRLQTLLMGSLGLFFSVRNIDTIHELFEFSTIIELNDLHHDDKSLVMMFILTFLREYRERHPSSSLAHVTVIEEAHNVLGQVESSGQTEGSGSDVRAQAVEAFCNLLAEIRSCGEGLIICDQSPNKLTRDALRNTNLQITHQLRDFDDRDAMARTMIMDDEQRDFLGKLHTGHAAVFFTGLQKSTFIRVNPCFPLDQFKQTQDLPADELTKRIRTHMRPVVAAYAKAPIPFANCKHCTRVCQYGKAIHAELKDQQLDAEFADALSHPERDASFWLALLKTAGKAAAKIGAPDMLDAHWCFLTQELLRHRPSDATWQPEDREKFETTFEELNAASSQS